MIKTLIFITALIFSSSCAYAGEIGQIKITAKGNSIIASLEDNAASRAFYNSLPVTLNMRDLYSREMCCFMTKPLPTSQLTASSYNVGDIIYWPPRHCLVILYEQNGEKFQRQHMGHIDYGVEIFKGMGDALVTFEKLELTPSNDPGIAAPEKIEFE